MKVVGLAVSIALSFGLGAPGPVTRAPSALNPHAGDAVDHAKHPMGYVLGRSLGSPTDGKLIGGSHLDDAPYLRVVPVYAENDVRWGLGSLVGLIDRAARSVRRQYPDAILSTGHLSRKGGGELDRHASHESGRDADVAFYVRSQTGKPLFAEHFVPFKGDGTAPSWPGAYFDDARNWALVSALVSDPIAHVTHIFVATPLRARLLAYAEKIGAPPAIRQHAAELMAQPHGALPHDDHFHVRVGCPNGMVGCVENPTAPKPKIAHVPVPHGRARTPHAAPPAAPPASPASPGAPSSPPSAPRSTAPDPDRMDEAPAMLIDDVDGLVDPAR